MCRLRISITFSHDVENKYVLGWLHLRFSLPMPLAGVYAKQQYPNPLSRLYLFTMMISILFIFFLTAKKNKLGNRLLRILFIVFVSWWLIIVVENVRLCNLTKSLRLTTNGIWNNIDFTLTRARNFDIWSMCVCVAPSRAESHVYISMAIELETRLLLLSDS